jgi:transcriptional regulator with XRE-family HTH domain
MATRTPNWLVDQIRQNVRLLKSIRGVGDEAIAKKAGYSSRQVFSNRLSGRTDITAEDMARISSALDVEPFVLMLRSDEALRWVEDHPTYKPPRYRKQPKNTAKARR